MSNITIRVPKELKVRMEQMRHVNWSEIPRRAFEEVIRREEMSRAAESINLSAKSDRLKNAIGQLFRL